MAWLTPIENSKDVGREVGRFTGPRPSDRGAAEATEADGVKPSPDDHTREEVDLTPPATPEGWNAISPALTGSLEGTFRWCPHVPNWCP